VDVPRTGSRRAGALPTGGAVPSHDAGPVDLSAA
jgi:hypothetical protein